MVIDTNADRYYHLKSLNFFFRLIAIKNSIMSRETMVNKQKVHEQEDSKTCGHLCSYPTHFQFRTNDRILTIDPLQKRKDNKVAYKLTLICFDKDNVNRQSMRLLCRLRIYNDIKQRTTFKTLWLTFMHKQTNKLFISRKIRTNYCKKTTI